MTSRFLASASGKIKLSLTEMGKTTDGADLWREDQEFSFGLK